MNIYKNNPWKSVKHTVLKSDVITEQVHHQGFSINSLLSEQVIDKLADLFNTNHKLENEKGGMFYSIYSQDIEYRNTIHNGISEIISPLLDIICKDYKLVLNSFIVKISGPESEFYIHQDTTSLDESKFSPLTLWIPLQDVTEQNGCLGIIPHSQHFFSPFRNISFPSVFDLIQSTVKQYLKPLPMKKGDVLIFDNRALHHSYSNISEKNRIVVICGLLPQEASLITCHKPAYEFGGKMELIEHADAYLLNGKNFLIDCQKRPTTGESLGWIEDPYGPIDEETFEFLCNQYGVKKNDTNTDFVPTVCNMIGEPK